MPTASLRFGKKALKWMVDVPTKKVVHDKRFTNMKKYEELVRPAQRG